MIKKKEKTIKIVKCLFILYCIALFFILFLYGSRTGNQFHVRVFSKEHFEMTNIVPFRTIFSYLESAYHFTINTNIVVTNLLGNLLMFIPMGMALPVLFEKKFDKLWKTILCVAVIVLFVEITQFLTFRGSADIDDLLLNTISSAIGYGIIKMKFVRKTLGLDEL